MGPAGVLPGGLRHLLGAALPIARASGSPDNTTEFVQNARGVTMYDPATDQWAHVDTCFATHHLNFGYDADNTLYLGGNSNDVPAGEHPCVPRDRQLRAGPWAGRRSCLTPTETGCATPTSSLDEIDPAMDTRIDRGMGDLADPSDRTSSGDRMRRPGGFLRVTLGDNLETALSEFYAPPFPTELAPGMDVDSQGRPWRRAAEGTSSASTGPSARC